MRTFLSCAALVVAGALPVAALTNLTHKVELTLRETYDDNVFILDTEASPAITPPPNSVIAVADKESFVTTITPALSLSYRLSEALVAGVSYAPDIVRYHSASTEDYFAHRSGLTLQGKIREISYDMINSLVWIDGNHLTPTVLRPGDCRAIGGIPLRDRRDAIVYKNGLKATIPLGDWFVRPVVNTYVHDFRTAHRPNTNASEFLYENYIDRWEVSGGVDVGYEVRDKTFLVAGYRRGHQEQGEVLGNESRFSNDYNRFLLGIEGAPFPWLKLAVLAGPDVRSWNSDTPAAFRRDELLWYVDGTITVLPTRRDTVTFRFTRFEQPAFTSQSVYEDIRYDLALRHRWTEKFTTGAGFTLYIGDWRAHEPGGLDLHAKRDGGIRVQRACVRGDHVFV
jgi:hypothetical protein